MTTTRITTFATVIFALATSAFGQTEATIDGLTYIVTNDEASVKWDGESTKSNFEIPGSVTIGSVAYDVTSIAASAFEDCTTLSSVTIAENDNGAPIEICDYAFYGCTNLNNITISRATVSAIGKSAFYNCSISSITIPDGIKSIGDYAFYNTKLNTFTSPSTLTSIGTEVFCQCGSLNSVTLNRGITTIGDKAFYKCTNLATINIPITVETIGQNAFYECTSLKEITIPKSVNSLGSYVFMNCTALTKVSFEGGGKLTSIPDHTFAGCTTLRSVEFGNGLTEILGYTFSGCTSLTDVTVPESFTFFQAEAFYGCTALSTIRCYAQTPPTVGTGVFSNIASNKTIYVPNNAVEAYKETYSDFTIKRIYSFNGEDADGTAVNTDKLEADGKESLTDVFDALSNGGDYANADVTIASDVTYTPMSLDLEGLSAENIFATVSKVPTISSYGGTMTGATISNLTARSNGVFGTITADGTVQDLMLDNATIYVDPTDEAYTTEGDDTYIHLLAKKIDGTVRGFGFTGDLIVDADLAEGRNIIVTLADQIGDDAEVNGYFYIDDLATTGTNKRCITIKQNLGTRTGTTSTKVKVANVKSLETNKSLTGNFEYTDAELMKNVREFTAEEFASGVVAYWLNFSGPGYTGNYTGYWSQGAKVPIPAINGNALHKVDYGETDLGHVTSAPTFANNGSMITITCDEVPTSVMVGSTPKTVSTKSFSLAFNKGEAINISFGNDANNATAIGADTQANVSVNVSGLNITVSGANGTEKRLISTSGATVATTTGQVLSAPAAGIYLLTTGGKAQKVIVK